MNTDDLDSKTDAALNRIFGVEVAGIYNKKGRKRKRRIDYCNDPSAVISYLSTHHCDCRNNAGSGWQISLYSFYPTLHAYAASHAVFITFARAACIALIRAKRNGSGP